MTVTLVEKYNPLWRLWFEQLKARLEDALHSIPHTIEHVGSTAAPGMTAKPIIDIDIVCEHREFLLIRECLEAIGYVHEGDEGIQGREAFNLADANARLNLPSHHLYVCEKSGDALREHLAFRDFMRQHPEWRQKLNDLKWRLCEVHDNDRQAYIEGKSAMVREITVLALSSTK